MLNIYKYQLDDKTTNVKNVPTIFYKLVPLSSALTILMKNTESSPKKITNIICSIVFKN